MFLVRFGLLLCFLTFAYAGKRPWRSEKKFQIEILSTNQTSIQLRFRQLQRVRKYFFSVDVKYLADVRSPYTKKLKKKRDRKADGYFYIDTKNVLQPGTLYEVSVYRLRQHRLIKNVDVFTDCDDYSYSCEASHGQMCLSSEQLCDGRRDCKDGSDEARVEEACAVKLPERPTPPPPPMDTPCMRNRTATLARAESNGTEMSDTKLPSCGDDGHYQPMDCDSESMTCYCVHPLTGEILKTQTNFHPFVHYNFADTCIKKAKKKLAEEQGTGDEDAVPEVEPPYVRPPFPEIPPPFDGTGYPELPPLPEGEFQPSEFPPEFGGGSIPEIPSWPEMP